MSPKGPEDLLIQRLRKEEIRWKDPAQARDERSVPVFTRPKVDKDRISILKVI